MAAALPFRPPSCPYPPTRTCGGGGAERHAARNVCSAGSVVRRQRCPWRRPLQPCVRALPARQPALRGPPPPPLRGARAHTLSLHTNLREDATRRDGRIVREEAGGGGEHDVRRDQGALAELLPAGKAAGAAPLAARQAAQCAAQEVGARALCMRLSGRQKLAKLRGADREGGHPAQSHLPTRPPAGTRRATRRPLTCYSAGWQSMCTCTPYYKKSQAPSIPMLVAAACPASSAPAGETGGHSGEPTRHQSPVPAPAPVAFGIGVPGGVVCDGDAIFRKQLPPALQHTNGGTASVQGSSLPEVPRGGADSEQPASGATAGLPTAHPQVACRRASSASSAAQAWIRMMGRPAAQRGDNGTVATTLAHEDCHALLPPASVTRYPGMNARELPPGVAEMAAHCAQSSRFQTGFNELRPAVADDKPHRHSPLQGDRCETKTIKRLYSRIWQPPAH